MYPATTVFLRFFERLLLLLCRVSRVEFNYVMLSLLLLLNCVFITELHFVEHADDVVYGCTAKMLRSI